MEFRPGIVALRPLRIGDLYGGVLKAVRGNPAATIGLAALTTFAFLLPTTALGAWLSGQSGLGVLDESAAASDTLPDGAGAGLFGVYLPTIGQLLSGILLAGFLAQVVGQAVLGRKVSMSEVWRATRGRLLAMVGAVLVTIVAFLLVLAVTVGGPIAIGVATVGTDMSDIGLVILLVFVSVVATVLALAFLGTKWAFATPAIVLERVGVFRGWVARGGSSAAPCAPPSGGSSGSGCSRPSSSARRPPSSPCRSRCSSSSSGSWPSVTAPTVRRPSSSRRSARASPASSPAP
ncbi:hypothetical protein G7075_10990 [Phycicoccus sp. HDW14]|uniref:hypothetical protein n=1 Tax=Phycicoccus sp. HDW14 TaxID=2714941 RepID=UPI00140994FF|nr:hypothetical protein [Phycicoccus sp. HDW14]QIM21534.1 hypothetical protein G7075_10990 [Phycicoccus sp. HDW14]